MSEPARLQIPSQIAEAFVLLRTQMTEALEALRAVVLELGVLVPRVAIGVCRECGAPWAVDGTVPSGRCVVCDCPFWVRR